MKSRGDLVASLRRIDGRGYKAYKSIAGRYDFGRFVVSVDHVQGDPFASPSRVSAVVPMGEAKLSPELLRNGTRRTALEDFLSRAFCRAASKIARGRRGTGKSGMVSMETPGQAVLERTSVLASEEEVEARFVMGLPAAGRRVLAREAIEMFDRELPAIVGGSLFSEALPGPDLERHVDSVEQQEMMRGRLDELGLVAFVADGSILPRRSGIDDGPMSEQEAVPFKSPDSLRVTIECPPYPPVSGMGVPKGVTLIVGGGYHGKSTLLSALERSVYPHVPGDGRELVVSHPASLKVRAEDGRSVKNVDISAFIGSLPSGADTRDFSTENASGSTSQAANIIEGLEAGASALLIDEDTSATNFMIRDERMKSLVPDDKEPITPFIDRARALYAERGVSTVLVTGGSGEYLEVADTVVMMDNYAARDVTSRAREVAESFRRPDTARPGDFGAVSQRIPDAGSFSPGRGRKEVAVKARGLTSIDFGMGSIDISALSQMEEEGQTRGIGDGIVYCLRNLMDGSRTLAEILDAFEAVVDEEGLDAVVSVKAGFYARPRRFELAGAIDRLRSLGCRIK